MNNEQAGKTGQAGQTGPTYLSQAEWQGMRFKKRKRLVLLLSLIPAAGILTALFVVYSALSTRYAAHKKLLDALTGLKNYSVKIYAIDPSGKKSQWREELYYNENFQIRMFSGKVIFQKLGDSYTYAEPSIHGQRGTMAWATTKPFLNEVEAVVPPFEPIQSNPSNLVESKDHGHHVYTFTVKDMTYSVRFDENDKNPAEIFVGGNGLNGTARIMQCVITPLLTPPFNPPGPAESSIHSKDKSPLPMSFTGPSGNETKVVAADINVRGDAFFLIRTPTDISVSQITREQVDRYYNPEVSDIKINGQPFVLVKYIALDDNEVKWPTTLDASFTPGSTRVAGGLSFKYTFNEPTCYLLPLEMGMPVSDLTCTEFLFDAAQSRANYFANSFVKDGIPKMFQGPVSPGYKEIPGDRLKSVREDVAASFYGHQLMMAGEDVSGALADSWGSAAHLLGFLGSSQEAHNAFSAADALRIVNGGDSRDPTLQRLR